MKTFSFILSSIFLTFSAFCQMKDPEAKAILDEATSKINSFPAVNASFSYTIIDKIEDTESTHEGNVQFMDNKFKLEFAGVITYSNGKAKWVYMPEVEEVNVYSIEENQDEQTDLLNDPKKLLTIYEEGFKYKLLGEETVDGNVCYKIDLVPEDLSKSYSRIMIWIDKNEKKIYQLKYYGKAGKNFIITINQLEGIENPQESDFVFNKEDYPDAEVYDFRE